MSEKVLSVRVEGLEEVQKAFDEMVKKYPDYAGELLKKKARDFRKDVTREVRAATDTKGTGKQSLAKAESYGISPVKGLGSGQYVEIQAKSPHFHLVEHGHELKTKDGRTIGFVPGRLMMAAAEKRLEARMPQAVEEMLDDLLRHGGLL